MKILPQALLGAVLLARPPPGAAAEKNTGNLDGRISKRFPGAGFIRKISAIRRLNLCDTTFHIRTGVTVSHPSDETDLIARATQNDPAAVRAIISLYNRRLYRLARSVVRDDHEAEDVLQAAYGRAFTNLREFRAQSGICTWLARIVLNEALGRLRVQRTHDLVPLQDREHAKSLPLEDKEPDPERLTAQREIQRLLEKAIGHLPQEFRLVLVMRTIEGMSIEETAELLGIRPESVKTRLHRARSILRAELEKDIGPLLTDTFPFDGERCQRLTARALEHLKGTVETGRPIC
jgi:RNA polymerase sigma-70 factor (ECF subfamily)